MAELEELKPGVKVKGILPQQEVIVVGVTWHGTVAVELTYKRPNGQTGNQLLFRSDEDNLEVVQSRRIWTFCGDGDLLRLVAEAYWIHLAHLNDESELVRSMAAWALGELQSERAVNSLLALLDDGSELIRSFATALEAQTGIEVRLV